MGMPCKDEQDRPTRRCGSHPVRQGTLPRVDPRERLDPPLTGQCVEQLVQGASPTRGIGDCLSDREVLEQVMSVIELTNGVTKIIKRPAAAG
jgi:hypothetical protein